MKKVLTARVSQRGRTFPPSLRLLFLFFFLGLVVLQPLPAEERQVSEGTTVGEKTDQAPGEARNASLDEAIEAAMQQVAADPSSETEYTKLGYLLLDKGDYKEAEKAFDEALALNGRYHDALTGKGIVFVKTGDDEAAEETLQKALILNPNPVRTHYELGVLYEKKGDLERAIAEYKKGIEKYKQGRK